MTIGWGVLGPGQYADRHIMPAINQSASGELIAVSHYQKEKAEFFAARNGAKRSYTSLGDMLCDSEVDVVAVCTPVNQHKEQVIQAAQAGKHVVCEFPMEVTVAACRSMVEACQKGGSKLMMGFQHRFHPVHREMRRLISSGEIGEVTFVEARFSIPWGGGVLGGQTYWKIPPRPEIEYPGAQRWKQNPAVRGGFAQVELAFPVDALRFLLGWDVVEVVGISDILSVADGRETIASGLLQFEGDIYGFVCSNQHDPYGENDIAIYGTEGRLKGIGALGLDTTGRLEIFKARGTTLTEDLEADYGKFHMSTLSYLNFEGERATKIVEFPGSNMYVDLNEAINRCIEEDTDPASIGIATGIDGLRQREIAVAVVESSRCSKTIRLEGK